jgi:hypothetical protein
MPYFISVDVTDAKSCSKTGGHALVIKNRGHDDVELILEDGRSTGTFLLSPTDPFLYLGPSKFTKICYKKSTSTHNEKCRLDIAVLD